MDSRAESGERLRVEREGEVLYLRLEWYTHATWRFLPFALGFLVCGVGGLLVRNDAFVGFLLSAAFGLLLSYVTTAGLINHTRIKASPREGIAVEHGPLPAFFFRSPSVDMKNLRQVYATRFEDTEGDVFHALWVMKKDGRSVLLTRDNLLMAPFTSEVVLELERRLEEHLGIQDAPVSVLGELRAH